MIQLNSIKKGKPYSFIFRLRNTTTDALITGIAEDLRSQARYQNGNLAGEFTISESNTSAGTYIFSLADTITDDLTTDEILYVDVEVTLNDVPQMSDIFFIRVEEAITR